MAGKSKKDKNGEQPGAVAPGVTPYIGRAAMQFQPAPGGTLEALAAQLQAGYGTPVAGNMDYLNNLYRPMSLPTPMQYDPAVVDRVEQDKKKKKTPSIPGLDMSFLDDFDWEQIRGA